jgi:hypothetical protein
MVVLWNPNCPVARKAGLSFGAGADGGVSLDRSGDQSPRPARGSPCRFLTAYGRGFLFAEITAPKLRAEFLSHTLSQMPCNPQKT